MRKGDLIQTTDDYIGDEGHDKKSASKKFGIVISTNEHMWSDEKKGTKVQWADNHIETVWDFEIEKVKV